MALELTRSDVLVAIHSRRNQHRIVGTLAVVLERMGIARYPNYPRKAYEDAKRVPKQHLLMRGYLDHHADPAAFVVDHLSPAAYAAFRDSVFRYFAEGYSDPALMALPQQDRELLARQYTGQFDGA